MRLFSCCGAGACREADAVLKARHQIATLLTLRCPRCSAAWLDFDGCCHVTCAACQQQFCACCLKTKGHKIGCTQAAHWAASQLQEAHNGLRRARLSKYLATLPGSIRNKALQACQQDLEDLGLSAREFYDA